MRLVFGNTGFLSYSHSRPGRVTVYVEGTELRNHSNVVMWNSATPHAVQSRMDAEHNEQQQRDEAEASRAALASVWRAQQFSDEPARRVRRAAV